VIDTAEQRNVLGVQFRPGGALPFLGMPADDLRHRHVSLEDVWGSGARLLRERILAIPCRRERCRLVEEELLARASGRLELRREVSCAVSALERESATVADVTEATGLSARRFSELFRTAVGLTPKAYSKVRRFQSALRKIESAPDPDWAGIALSCGYFDQSHFNHDFRAFSGIIPSNYAAIDKRHMNHVPIL
jgi:AraC-like DNA-binding protein